MQKKVQNSLKLFTQSNPNDAVQAYIRATFNGDRLCGDLMKILTMFNCENLLIDMIIAVVEELAFDESYGCAEVVLLL